MELFPIDTRVQYGAAGLAAIHRRWRYTLKKNGCQWSVKRQLTGISEHKQLSHCGLTKTYIGNTSLGVWKSTYLGERLCIPQTMFLHVVQLFTYFFANSPPATSSSRLLIYTLVS